MTDLLSLIGKADLKHFSKYYQIYKTQKKELTGRKMKTILEQEFKLESLGEFHKGLKEMIDANSIKIKEQLAVANNNGYVFITINPKPGVKLQELIKKSNKLINRKMFVNAIWAYEQRGSTLADTGKGFHIHILAKRNLNYKPSKVIRNTRNTCKGLVGNENNNSQLNIQIIGEDFAQDKKNYFLGTNKTGEGKDLKQSIDIVWRKTTGLLPFYEKL